MPRYLFVPDESRLFVHARSTIHGISTDADGVEGELDLALADDGGIDLTQPVHGLLRFELARLSSGNPLYDVETERRIEVKKHPLVEGRLTSIERLDDGTDAATDAGDGDDGDDTAVRYHVGGDLVFHGVTQALDGELGFRTTEGGAVVQIWGEQALDVRAWKINPPRLGLIKVHPDIRVRLEVTARLR